MESSNNSAQETSDESSNDDKFKVESEEKFKVLSDDKFKLLSIPEETYQKEIEILQKLFPQKDKVSKFKDLIENTKPLQVN